MLCYLASVGQYHCDLETVLAIHIHILQLRLSLSTYPTQQIRYHTRRTCGKSRGIKLNKNDTSEDISHRKCKYAVYAMCPGNHQPARSSFSPDSMAHEQLPRNHQEIKKPDTIFLLMSGFGPLFGCLGRRKIAGRIGWIFEMLGSYVSQSNPICNLTSFFNFDLSIKTPSVQLIASD